ncbi:MAG TPA: alpha-ketoacid dehydrogenase subunit beta [Armatimonadota bacterium]|jgi:pyruvate dehydrogenase E1 component beta subunit
MALMQYREALRAAMREEMERDDRVCLMGEEVGGYNGAYRISEGLMDQFGRMRVLDTPIAEEGFTGMALGASMVGLRPIVEYMTWNFSLVAYDQIVNHVAKARYMSNGQFGAPMVMRGPQGGGQQLTAQHSQCVESWYLHCPGLYVVTAATPADAKGLLKTAIRDDNPVIFLEHLGLYNMKGEVSDDRDLLIPFGVADVKRAGTDVTILTYSKMLYPCLQAAEELDKDEVSAEVIDLRSLRPLDLDAILTSVRKTHHVVVVTEDWQPSGMARELSGLIYQHAFDELDAPVEEVCGAPIPMPYAKNLEQMAIPDADAVKSAVRRTLARPGELAPLYR